LGLAGAEAQQGVCLQSARNRDALVIPFCLSLSGGWGMGRESITACLGSGLMARKTREMTRNRNLIQSFFFRVFGVFRG
jgi:hypothetical protein